MAVTDAMAPALPSAAAIVCLWRAWRGRGWPWVVASVAGGSAALLLWWQLAGAEFGSIYALGTTVLGAWAWIAATATRAGASPAGDRPLWRPAAPSAGPLLRGLGTALLVGPIALAAVVVACLHGVYWLPGEAAARWVAAAFALPLLWAAVATIVLGSERRGRAALALGALGGLGALLLPGGSLP